MVKVCWFLFWLVTVHLYTVFDTVMQVDYVFFEEWIWDKREWDEWDYRDHLWNSLYYIMEYIFCSLFSLVITFENYIIYRMSQEEYARLRESVPYVKVYRYNPKHLYLKLNYYGDNAQRKVRSSCGSTYCTFSANALRVHYACPWDWNAVNIVPACPCKVLGILRTTTALMRV